MLHTKKHTNQQGFTLIELGIVVAVMAVLGLTVLIGGGFMEAAKLTKAVSSINTLNKGVVNYMGLRVANGGFEEANVLPNLGARKLGALNDSNHFEIADGYLVPFVSVDMGDEWDVFSEIFQSPSFFAIFQRKIVEITFFWAV